MGVIKSALKINRLMFGMLLAYLSLASLAKAENSNAVIHTHVSDPWSGFVNRSSSNSTSTDVNPNSFRQTSSDPDGHLNVSPQMLLNPETNLGAPEQSPPKPEVNLTVPEQNAAELDDHLDRPERSSPETDANLNPPGPGILKPDANPNLPEQLPSNAPDLPQASEQASQADEILMQAIAIANTLEAGSTKATILGEIALQYAELGQDAQAAESLSQALGAANAIQTAAEKAKVLSKIALQYAEIGPLEQSTSVLSEAVQTARTIDNAPEQATVLSELALQYLKLGQGAQATDVLLQATAVADGVEDPQAKAGLLAELALRYADLGQYERSSQLLTQGQQIQTPVQTAEAAADEPFSAFKPTPWRGSLGLASNIFTGERTRGTVRFDVDAKRQWRRNKLETGIALVYDFDVDRDDDVEILGKFDTEFRRSLSERFQYFISSEVTSDNIENLDLLAILNGGIAVNLWRVGSERSLDFQVGAGARFENFEDDLLFEGFTDKVITPCR
ncbi:MAG: DUF481 domain-containing protein, partial [Cyanothece sp. SIO1E1]|nr:DUF481 domain-containing protein [Cyanothece sp. SIO1E1]